jgi:glutathione S-transferase
MFIAEKGMDIETVEVDMRNGEQMSPEYRALNPHCTVPTLVLDSGRCLLSTAAIRQFLEAKQPSPSMLGETPEERGVIADLLYDIESSGLAAVAEAFRNRSKGFVGRAIPGPVGYDQIPELAERGAARLRHFFDGIDQMIGDKQFLAGDKFSAADIDLLVLIDFAGWVKQTLPDDAANAKRWYDAVSNRPSAKL